MEQTIAVDTDEVYERVVTGVAALEGTEPVELPPLFEAIDPDALAAAFATTESGIRRSGTVEFTYADHQIRVSFEEAGNTVVTID
ncbi:HalOD1 output domain-containing protein [Natrinema sp. HArc-T2]|uniref:HalOD1 output domain-containing protein n=1 Tax=Natrinema sp. HArc-T2 TaxID=3242701 RepID=UPI00359DAE4E